MPKHEQIDVAAIAVHPPIPDPHTLIGQEPASPSDGSPYLTVAEAAAFLRLKPRTLDNMRGNGIGPTYCKHGGRIRYSFSDVVAWSKASRRRSTAEKAA